MTGWIVSLLAILAFGCRSTPDAPEGAVSLRDDVFVQALRPGVWRHVSFRSFPGTGPFPSNGLIARAERGSILVDTAWNPEQTAAILDWTEESVGPVLAVLVTHAHDDRLGGLPEVRERGIPSVALAATAERALRSGGPAIDRSVVSGYRLEAFGVRGELSFPGAGHTDDNAVVHLDDSRVLAGTCMVRAGSAKTLGNVAEAPLDSWPGAIRRLQERYPEVAIVVPGHGEPGGPDLLAHTLELLAE